MSTPDPAGHTAPSSRREAAGRPIGRRGLLLGVAGAAAAGAGADEAVRAARGGPTAGAVTPGESLMTEHGVLKRVLLVYRAADSAPWTAATSGAVQTCASVIRDYIEGFHELLEEQYVFPRLTAAGVLTSTVQTLLLQHGRGRQLTSAILELTQGGTVTASTSQQLTAHLQAFVRMYEPHEAREDTEIFPALRRVLGDRRSAGLGESFAAMEQKKFGVHSLTDVLEKVSAAETACGIADLAAFTPAPLT